MPKWYGSQISVDCQQNLLSPKHILAGDLPANLLKEQKREDDMQRKQITCLLENGKDCVEIKSSFREIRVT